MVIGAECVCGDWRRVWNASRSFERELEVGPDGWMLLTTNARTGLLRNTERRRAEQMLYCIDGTDKELPIYRLAARNVPREKMGARRGRVIIVIYSLQQAQDDLNALQTERVRNLFLWTSSNQRPERSQLLDMDPSLARNVATSSERGASLTGV